MTTSRVRTQEANKELAEPSSLVRRGTIRGDRTSATCERRSPAAARSERRFAPARERGRRPECVRRALRAARGHDLQLPLPPHRGLVGGGGSHRSGLSEAFRRRSEVVVVEGKLVPWLYGIATNVLRNRRRRSGGTAASSPSWRRRSGDVGPDVAERAEAAAQMRAVLEGVAGLPRPQQDVVALCIWSGSPTRRPRSRSACLSGPSARASRAPAPRWRNSTAAPDIRRVEMGLEKVGEE